MVDIKKPIKKQKGVIALLNDFWNSMIPKKLLKDNSLKWSIAKDITNSFRGDQDLINEAIMLLYRLNPSQCVLEPLREEVSDSGVLAMTSAELTENITTLLRQSFKDGKVSDIAKLAEITDKLTDLFKPKDDGVTAINVTVIDYSELPYELAKETGEVQDYSGLQGDAWLKQAWDYISKLSPSERVAWGKERDIL